jgi:hypothetical protein
MIKAVLSSETCVKISDTSTWSHIPFTAFTHFFEDDQREPGGSSKVVMEELLELLNKKFWEE